MFTGIYEGIYTKAKMSQLLVNIIIRVTVAITHEK